MKSVNKIESICDNEEYRLEEFQEEYNDYLLLASEESDLFYRLVCSNYRDIISNGFSSEQVLDYISTIDDVSDYSIDNISYDFIIASIIVGKELYVLEGILSTVVTWVSVNEDYMSLLDIMYSEEMVDWYVWYLIDLGHPDMQPGYEQVLEWLEERDDEFDE